MKLTSFMPPLYKIGEQDKNFLVLFLNLDTVLSNSTQENFANIWKIRWKWIRSMKFETVRIHVFGLLSSRHFAIMATWPNNQLCRNGHNIRHNKLNFSEMANSWGSERFRHAVCFRCILLWNSEEDWERRKWGQGTRHMAKEFGIFWKYFNQLSF